MLCIIHYVCFLGGSTSPKPDMPQWVIPVAVVVPLIVIILLVLIVFCCCKTRRASRSEPEKAKAARRSSKLESKEYLANQTVE